MNRFLTDRDEATFRELYRAYTPALYLFVLRIVGRIQEDAEEVVQETWIRAINGLTNFRWESSLKSWLCAIAMNICREISRRNKSTVELKIVHSETIRAKDTGNLSDVEKLISVLPDGCREVLVLHDIEGYTHKEIAQMMEITEGTSKSQLFRARAKLREMLKPFQEIS